MEIYRLDIDDGKSFDWGKTSADYAKYRDIYPEELFRRIAERGLCVTGQTVLDVGTGTGVLPRSMYGYGAKWTAADIAEEQIKQARMLSAGMDIRYFVAPAEEISFADSSFDVITACQCFWYFDHEIVMPKFARMLKKDGRILILYLAWLPFEDPVAGASEDLVLKYSPDWSGAGETVRPITIPECYSAAFELAHHEEFRIRIPFTRETWHGRMRTCRGVGASLTCEELAAWDAQHQALLDSIAPEEFEVLHYAAAAELKKR